MAERRYICAGCEKKHDRWLPWCSCGSTNIKLRENLNGK